MWGKIDEYIREKFNGRLNRSEFFEDYIRQTLEEKGKESMEDPGVPMSVNTARAYTHRIKDFIFTNSKEQKIGNLEAIRRDLAEASAFCDQEIRRSRAPTKRDKKELALKLAIAAHRARIGSNGIMMNALPVQDTKDTEEEEKESVPQSKRQEPELDPVELEYEQLRKEAYVDFKEDPLPKPDFEIIEEGRTERNTFNNDGEEILK